ncbi:MAG: glycosyltransferase [Candidatus Moranbacteria bacterium]|nr:glycosyltransferase [Candidatus Moranbacteria bacterium]
MKKMLVNIVNLNPEGIQIIWLIKMKKWEELGYDIYIQTGLFIKQITLKGKDVYAFNAEMDELRVIPEERFTKLRYIWYALRRNFLVFRQYGEVRAGSYDVLYTLTSVLEFTLFPFFYRLFHPETKWITVFDNTVPLQGPGNKGIRFLAWVFFHISLQLLRRADKVYVITLDLETYLLEHGFKRTQVVLTGCAVEGQRIREAVIDERYTFDALFMGRINEKKGIYDMLESLALIVKERPNFRLGIMGGGDEPTVKAYQERIQKMNLEQNVFFLGYKVGAEKFNVIKSSKLFWFFSYDESFGVALLEAVCSGKQALVYNLPPFRHLYRHNEVIIIPWQDYAGIAGKTLELLRNGMLENEAGKKLLDAFSWDTVVTKEYEALKS